jgi:hypothetical protein
MSMPGFISEALLNQNSYYYGERNQPARLENDTIVLASGRCPVGCYEANVACTGFLLWNTCWCPNNGRTCPTGGWWVGGACLGAWQLGCIGTGGGFPF